MRILGLDPGSRVCGYGVIDVIERSALAKGSVVGMGSDVRYVECGTLTAPADHAMEDRLGEIARGLREVLAELAPTVVALEDVFSHENPRSALALAQARGMALAVCGLHGLVVASYAPALVKKSVTGNGRSDKAQVAAMVSAMVGLASLPRADATDALAVAITHARIARPMAARIVPAVVPAGAVKVESMIARLSGTIIERDAPHVVIDCNGVGYDVVCSQYTLAALPSDGERVVLHIFTQASENKIGLIGFFDRQERELFDHLITVKNVGPSTAVAILSGSSPREIATAIAREDVAALTRIKGVGKKTAELLCVELHEKCELMVLSWNLDGGVRPVASGSPAAAIKKPTGRHPMLDAVASALVGMGWRPIEADAAVAELPGEIVAREDTTIEVLLRQALRSMPR